MKLSNVMVLSVFFCVAVFVAPTFGTVSSSAHDFTARAWNTGNELCEVCHTVHNADLTVVSAPLWNHEVTTKVWPALYNSTTLDATLTDPTESKLCLSCHDGTVAIDSYGGNVGSEIIGAAGLIDDLTKAHPIGFTYDAILASNDGGLQDPTVTNSGLGGTITDDMLGIGGNMSCASCHDVHDSTGIAKLLRLNNTNSALCTTCHNK